ncbi:deoxyribodipyrimidine photo-lyase [Rubripirellula reticaptiva]|uniref:Deoxyribodipyrimidine photo-lyase n=1 Tax=Rubripirellula reticaptiva TaxID=2528013 RepID=A0A5C6EGD2_9BACT|nr:deoxyribodipyrimidine photo-lyase [Rubripirellula reticaptiva]TWU46821.1 deoxyribodipyrimidine photolyase [Rubripirellula reticaptiva]
MASSIIQDDRIKRLNDKDCVEGAYTLYWMQQAQRSECNHALEFAVQRANENKSGLLVAFGLTEDYPDANHRHYRFMLEGLANVANALNRRSIAFVVRNGKVPDLVSDLARDACELICDRGYLRHQVEWREIIANEAPCAVWQVESDVIVPVEIASDKREYAARTIRTQINETAKGFFTDLSTTSLEKDSTRLSVNGLDLTKIDDVLLQLSVDDSVRPVDDFKGGTSQAKAKLKTFLSRSLGSYDDPISVLDPAVSFLSPYLHFGQISPLAIAIEVQQKMGVSTDAKDAFLEELLVRRELAINFVHYEKEYDSLKCLPSWAADTLDKHESDKRNHHYSATELENAETHDPAWNAAMIEMKHRGYLHNHLRMYWGKKIIQWTNTTAHAYRTALDLNNKYFLDGRDANSYANVAWLFGLHDRAHQERPIFGKVRYMSADGLRRKIDVDTYVSQIENEFESL